MFIAFDGIDGAGKSTQIRLLREHLDKLGKSCVAVRDPGTTPAGEAIRRLVLDSDLEMHRRCEALLYMAARSQLVEQLIRPALAEKRWVVSDRFLLANVVYQSVQGGEDADLLWRLGAIATGNLKPDLTILLDMPAESAFARIDRPADRMESRGLEYLSAVREGFLRHVPSASEHHIIVDADQPIETIHQTIIGRLSDWVKAK